MIYHSLPIIYHLICSSTTFSSLFPSLVFIKRRFAFNEILFVNFRMKLQLYLYFCNVVYSHKYRCSIPALTQKDYLSHQLFSYSIFQTTFVRVF